LLDTCFLSLEDIGYFLPSKVLCNFSLFFQTPNESNSAAPPPRLDKNCGASRRRLERKLGVSPVNLFPVTHLNNIDKQVFVFDGVDDAILTFTNSIPVALPR
jgi:hypothetical protein